MEMGFHQTSGQKNIHNTTANEQTPVKCFTAFPRRVSQYVNKDVGSRRGSDSERFAFNNSPKNSCCLRRRPNDTNRKLQQELHGIFTNTQAQK